MVIKHYWDEENNFKNYDNLRVKNPTLINIEVTKDKNLLWITEREILFSDAEKQLLWMALFSIIVLLSVIL